MQYSDAYNSVAFLSGGADPQTGLYTLSFPFGEVLSANGLGPSFSLSMNYSPLSTGTGGNKGMGNGWSLNLPNVDRTRYKMTLPGGQTYTIDQDNMSLDQEWLLKNHKTKDVKILHDNTASQILIQGKDRSMVIIDDNNQNESYGQILRYEGADGRYITFEGSDFGSGWRLENIKDHEGNALAGISYGDLGGAPTGITTVTLYPGSLRERIINLTLNTENDFQLISITSSEPDIVYTFDHATTDQYYFISSVTYPSGVREEMEYDNEIYIPGSGSTKVISTYTKHYGEDNTLIQTFDFDPNGDQNNYFGNGFISTVQEDDDLMQDQPGEYHYASVVTEGPKKIKRSWNKFHQQIEEITTFDEGKTVKLLTNTYYSDETYGLAEQEDRYELQTGSIVQFIEYEDSTQAVTVNISQQFTKTSEYDSYGNVTEETDINGVTQSMVYYTNEDDATGFPEGSAVPVHPFGLVDMVLKKTTTAESDASLTEETFYYYKALDKAIGDGLQYRLFTEQFSNLTATYTYHEGTDLYYHGKQHTKEIRQEGGEGDDARTSVETKTYSEKTADDSIIITTATSNAQDGAVMSVVAEQDIYYQLILGETDQDNIKTSYTYDNAGRLSGQTNAEGTDYEQTLSLHYLQEDDFKGWCLQRTDESSGLKAKIYANDQQELHKVLEQQAVDGDFYKTKEILYDNTTYRVLKETAFDYAPDGTKICETGTEYTYDHWGMQNTAANDQGVIKETTYDPFTFTTTERVLSPPSDSGTFAINAYSKKAYNRFGAVILDETMLGEEVYATESAAYDAFGRACSSVNKAGFSVDIAYDDFGRAISFEDSMQGRLEIAYQRSTVTEAVDTMQLSNGDGSYNEALVRVVCDGLNRATSVTTNGKLETYSYPATPAAGKMLFGPDSKTNGRGQVMEFGYVTELGEEKELACTDDPSVEHTYAFSNKDEVATYPLGSIKNVTNPEGSNDFTYSADGFMSKSEAHYFDDSFATTTEVKEKTLGGKPLKVQVTDPDGNSKTIDYQYDMTGNLVNLKDGELEIIMDYDPIDRPLKQTIKDPDGTTLQVKDYQYDIDYARLSGITITQGDNVFSQHYTYHAYDKLQAKTTEITLSGGSLKSLAEEYDYDQKMRLTSYSAQTEAPELLPVDELGNSIQTQAFTYNVNDALLTVGTTFEDGSTVDKAFNYDSNLLLSIETVASGGDYPAYTGFDYDADGNLTSISEGADAGSATEVTAMTYNAFCKMTAYGANAYTYDGMHNLISMGGRRIAYDLEGTPVLVQESGALTHFTAFGGEIVGEKSGETQRVIGTDPGSSSVFVSTSGQSSFTGYSCFGIGQAATITGFNNQLRDTAGNNYHPGKGERTYMPGYAIFTSRDSMSPLGEGGLNGYIYCQGDPVNLTDPTGNFSMDWLASIGGILAGIAGAILAPVTGGSSLAIGLGIAGGIAGSLSAGLSLGSKVKAEKGDTEAAKNLSIASGVFGLVSTLTGIGSAGVDTKNKVKGKNNAKSIEKDSRHAFKGDDHQFYNDILKDKSVARNDRYKVNKKPKKISTKNGVESGKNNKVKFSSDTYLSGSEGKRFEYTGYKIPGTDRTIVARTGYIKGKDVISTTKEGYRFHSTPEIILKNNILSGGLTIHGIEKAAASFSCEFEEEEE